MNDSPPVGAPVAAASNARLWLIACVALALVLGGALVAFSPRLRPVPETPAICEHLLKLGEDRPDDRGVIESIVAPEFLYGEPGPRLPSVDEQCNWYYDRLRKKDPPDLFARKATCSLGAADGQALMKCFHP